MSIQTEGLMLLSIVNDWSFSILLELKVKVKNVDAINTR